MARPAEAPIRRLVSIGTAADYLSCHPKTIRRRIADGTLVAYRLGPKHIRVDLAQVDALLRPIPAGVGGGDDAA